MPTAPTAPNPPQATRAAGGAPVTERRSWWAELTPDRPATPWGQYRAPTARQVSVVPPASQWKLADIAQNESTFVQAFKDLLWERYQAADDGERNTLFWQGVKQNPELAAATFVRRMLANKKIVT